MAWFTSSQQECLRDSTRKDFKGYRRYYGIAPPEHEPHIRVGDLGRFTPDGEFIRLGCMFESSGQTILEKCHAERWLGVTRSTVGNVVISEEMVFEPFMSPTTTWTHVPEDRLKE